MLYREYYHVPWQLKDRSHAVHKPRDHRLQQKLTDLLASKSAPIIMLDYFAADYVDMHSARATLDKALGRIDAKDRWKVFCSQGDIFLVDTERVDTDAWKLK